LRCPAFVEIAGTDSCNTVCIDLVQNPIERILMIIRQIYSIFCTTLALSALVLIFIISPALAAPALTFTLIDVPGTTTTEVDGINASGKIVGIYQDGDTAGTVHSFVRDNNRTFTTIDFPGAISTAAEGINRSGKIVGFYDTDGTERFHGFLLDRGTFTTFDPPGSSYTQAIDINVAGKIVGRYKNGVGPYQGFLRNTNNTFVSFDFPSASETSPGGINAAGKIVGSYRDTNGTSHGFLLDNGAFTTIDVPGATAPNGTWANRINDAGQIVGYYYNASGTHGFLLNKGVFTTIDVTPCAKNTFAAGINSQNQIVGYYEIADGTTHGFIAE
jgi:probable HAF family extracellular repeat protein